MLKFNRKENVSIHDIIKAKSPMPNAFYTFSKHPGHSKLSKVYESVIEQMEQAFILLDSRGVIIKTNRETEKLLETSQRRMQGKHILDLYTELVEDRTKIPDELHHLDTTNPNSNEITTKLIINDQSKFIHISIKPIIHHNRTHYSLFCQEVTTDFEEQKQLLEKLSDTEIQFREMNHRIKNNLQLVNSIMNLEYDRHKPFDQESVYSLIKESQNKIYAIALIHQNLYENHALNTITVTRYIKQLFSYISNLYKNYTKNVFLEIEDEWKEIPVKDAIYIGLIIDEILTNSFKHAFHHHQNGKITIVLKKSKDYATLHLRDNGAGFIVKDYKTYHSFGMELIFTLVKQLKGKIEIKSEGGTEYRIKFPLFC
ncbi:MAG: PAS domain S-box protein [Candidatus Marinimicrobia bacterium]|nr:PAS domain S-box protein [Candidatus Neomarinimicrobiota bacterium]